MATNSDRVIPNAPDSRANSAAVGWTSPRSILAIMARDTPEAWASTFTDHPRSVRADDSVAANDSVSPSAARTSEEASTARHYSAGFCYYLLMLELSPHIRPAAAADAAACGDIYAPYVVGTNVTFEVEPPTTEQFWARIAHAQAAHEWLVAERNGTVLGYAYGHQFHERAAYDWSCETSIYLDAGLRRQGVGRALYRELLGRLAGRGYRRAFAGIALPNDASFGLHRALGFEDAGCFRRVGWKNGAWHDVAWMQRDLQSCEFDPPNPISPTAS